MWPFTRGRAPEPTPPGAAAPRTPRCAFRPQERRSDRRGGPTAHEWSEQESAAMNPLNNLPRSESLNI